MKRLCWIGLAISLFLILQPYVGSPPVCLAQRPDPPGIGDRPDHPDANNRGEDEDGKDNAVPSAVGTVYGYVYDYSGGGAPQSGITVVLDGGGWQAETVTDSEGFYQFAGLGVGAAKLNLKLPPEAHSVAPDWVVSTGNAAPDPTRLAFYWGDTPPMPVVLSVEEASVTASATQPLEFAVKVNNRSGGVATDAAIDLKLPATLTALEAETSHGAVDFADHRVQVRLGDIPSDQIATLLIKAIVDEEDAAAQGSTIRAALTYREQLTPQLVTVNVIAAPRNASTDVVVSETLTPDAAVEALIPTTGVEQSAPVVAWPGTILIVIFITGLSVAGFCTFKYNPKNR